MLWLIKMLMMGGRLYVFVLMLLVGIDALAIPLEDYWTNRGALLQWETEQSLGGHLNFELGERFVNNVLMNAKNEELKRGFYKPSKFAPARNFLEAKWDIENSKVFHLIQKMPKGGVLHAHSTAIVSDDYIFNNITYRDNLYACENCGKLSLRFFDKPSDDCDWKLLSELRKDPETAKSVDEKIRRELSMIDPTTDYHEYEDGNDAWNKFQGIFGFLSPLLKYRPVHEDHFYQGLQELYDDHVLYLEIRAGLGSIYDLDGTKYSPVEVARIFKDVSDRFVRDHLDFVGVKLIYAPRKTNDAARFDQYLKNVAELKQAFPDFFVGFDLVGQEDTSSPLFNWVEKLHEIAKDVPFFFHAGETNWQGMDIDENLLDAVLLNAKRIGHGYALMKHPKVVEMVKLRKIAIEVCPISNQLLNLVKDLRNHPASTLFVEDFPVVISNDDPGIWGAKALSYDFYEAFMGMMSARADIRAIKQLAINSIQYSSLNKTEKKRAMSIWKHQWTDFIHKFHRDPE